ncbi:MAG: hypothetical protein Q9178_004527 [Gyalolechia marmorata]
MSSPSIGHPLSKPTLTQHRQRKALADRMDSKLSDTTESTNASSTPPTLYDDDDALPEVARSDKPSGQQLFGTAAVPRSPSSVAESYASPGSYSLKSDASEDDVDDDQKNLNITVDPICAGEADGQCTLNSGDHRKVTSHVFGRNKRETHRIPEECWIKYCRKHYQRQKYRCPADWFETQLLLVDGQLDRLEAWGGVIDWTIQLRKKEREIVDKENNYQAIHGRLPSGPLSRERFLLPYLGVNKTFAEVRQVVDVINKECDDTENLTLPSFEFLPRIDERRNPRPRRGIARRGARPPVRRTPAPPITFRLATDGSGQVTKVETNAGHTSASGYTRSKAHNSAIKRSSSASDSDHDAEPVPRAPKKDTLTFRAANKQTTPLSGQRDKEVVGDGTQRLAKHLVAPSDNAEKGVVDIGSSDAQRPAKRHRKSYSV